MDPVFQDPPMQHLLLSHFLFCFFLAGVIAEPRSYEKAPFNMNHNYYRPKYLRDSSPLTRKKVPDRPNWIWRQGQQQKPRRSIPPLERRPKQGSMSLLVISFHKALKNVLKIFHRTLILGIQDILAAAAALKKYILERFHFR